MARSPHKVKWHECARGRCKVCCCETKVAQAGTARGMKQLWRWQSRPGVWTEWTLVRPPCKPEGGK